MPIPRRIIQTHRSEDVQRENRDSWMAHHPGWEYRFFDDAQCRDFIATHMPGLLPTYELLPLPVQKADLFRYAAVYQLGGVYADVDTVCCDSLANYVDLEKDHLVAGLEMSPFFFGDGMDRYVQMYCSPHQLLQWTFAAPARHPALAVLLDRIRFLVTRVPPGALAEYSRQDRFTLELTGPMVFTQVLNEFLSGTRPGHVTVLPRMIWASWPKEQERADLAGQIKVKHLFSGSWKQQAFGGQAARPSFAAPGAAQPGNVRFRVRT